MTRSSINLVYTLDVPRPLSNDLWTIPFQKVSENEPYVGLEHLCVCQKYCRKCLKPLFLEQFQYCKYSRSRLRAFCLSIVGLSVRVY